MSDSIGFINTYTCEECSAKIGSINLNSGATPFIITCPVCQEGAAQSSVYFETHTPIKEAFYFPAKVEFDSLDSGMQEYILQGAMLHAPIGKVTPFRPDPPPCKLMLEWKECTLEMYGKA